VVVKKPPLQLVIPNFAAQAKKYSIAVALTIRPVPVTKHCSDTPWV
jgi:hypothetical protein